MSGNWGLIPTGRSRRSRRSRIDLAIACAVIGIVLVLVLGQLGSVRSSEITGTVIVIVGLLVAGIGYELRPRGDLGTREPPDRR
jgi:hypothetical protein